MRTLCFFAIASCLVASTAAAQSTQVWVSGVGDDTNPGSRTAPVLSFAAGVAAAAPNGSVNALDAGQDWGDTTVPGDWNLLTLTQGVTLDGRTTNKGYHALGSIVINANATDVVVLRNLVLDGSVNPNAVGIAFNGGAALHIEHCVIKNFLQGGVVFAPQSAAQLFISDTRIEGVEMGAVSLNPNVSANATIVRSFLNSSGIGLAVDGNSQVTLVDTALQDNATAISAMAQHSDVDVNLHGGSVSGGSIGVESVASAGSAVVRLNEVASTNLVTPVQKTGGGQIVSFHNNLSPNSTAMCFADGYSLTQNITTPLVGISSLFVPTLTQAAGDLTLSLASGSLPAGLSLNGNAVTGTPTQSRNITFALTATDARGCAFTQEYALSIPEPDFSLAATDGPVATIGTQSVNANLLLMPVNGLVTDEVTFACNSNSGVDCSFSVDAAHLALGGTQVVVTLTPGTAFAGRYPTHGWLGLVAFGLCLGLRNNRRQATRRLFFLLLLPLAGCTSAATRASDTGGTGGSGTSTGGSADGGTTGSTAVRPDRQVTVTVTATSAGQIIHTADLQLTVTYPS